MVCPACGFPRLSEWFTKVSPVDGRAYPIFKCGECGSAFAMPRPEPEYLEKYYSDTTHSRDAAEAYEKVLRDERAYPNASIDSARIAARCEQLAPGNALLDVGAGYGFFSRAALDRGFHVSAIEPAEPCRDIYQRMNGQRPLAGMLTRDFVQANLQAFDVVLMSQVLEHIPDLESAVAGIAKLLRPNGIAAIAVPHFGSWLSVLQGRSDMFVVPPEHLNFFSRAGLTELFEHHGFVSCEIHTVSRFNPSRVSARLPFPLPGRGLAVCLLGLLRVSDLVKKGMFLNAYFRRLRTDSTYLHAVTEPRP